MTRIWEELAEARRRLLAGEAIGVPTETVYGLAALSLSEEAIRSVFQLKGRPLFDPLILHIGRHEDLKRCVLQPVPLAAQILADRFWPGPLTLVVPKASSISTLITAGADTVAVRLPGHPLARRIARTAGPFVAPSANRFKRTSPTSAVHVRTEFEGHGLYVLDGGDCSIGIESTVLGFLENEVVIYRPGAISEDDIQKALGPQFRVRPALQHSQCSTGHTEGQHALVSPGTSREHYRPAVPLHLLGPLIPPGVPGTVHLQKLLQALDLHYGGPGAELVIHDDPWTCARTLYRSMRDSVSSETRYLYVVRKREDGSIWPAIWDRLSRAQSEIPVAVSTE